jgi:FAD/FMN-containing dehydrogenase
MTGSARSLDLARHLSSEVSGEIFTPDHGGYDAARAIWNGMIDRHPLAVVRAASMADVAPVVAYAVRENLPLAVRGGGHNVAGNGTVDDGIVLDLGACRSVWVDPWAATVTVEAGATLADVDAATAPHELAVPIGVVSATGVAGLTLGGGFGWLTRAYGLTVDNLLAAEVATADGATVRASAEENPELLWALKGGGGNFGVVLSFTFAAHHLPANVFCGNLIYARPHWEQALGAVAAWTDTVPDEMTTILTAATPPPEWELGTEPLLLVGFAWAGTEHAAGETCLAELTAQAPPDARDVAPTPWPTWQSAMDELLPKGVRAYWKNTGFSRLEDVVDVVCARAAEQNWVGTAIDIHHMGGAFARVPAGATPFPDRSSGYWLNAYGFWRGPEDDERNIAFVRGLARDMEPYSTGAQYVNFMGRDPGGGTTGTTAAGPADAWATARQVYGEDTLRRLVDVKHRFDPQNVFRLNHNIPPLAPVA